MTGRCGRGVLQLLAVARRLGRLRRDGLRRRLRALPRRAGVGPADDVAAGRGPMPAVDALLQLRSSRRDGSIASRSGAGASAGRYSAVAPANQRVRFGCAPTRDVRRDEEAVEESADQAGAAADERAIAGRRRHPASPSSATRRSGRCPAPTRRANRRAAEGPGQRLLRARHGQRRRVAARGLHRPRPGRPCATSAEARAASDSSDDGRSGRVRRRPAARRASARARESRGRPACAARSCRARNRCPGPR